MIHLIIHAFSFGSEPPEAFYLMSFLCRPRRFASEKAPWTPLTHIELRHFTPDTPPQGPNFGPRLQDTYWGKEILSKQNSA